MRQAGFTLLELLIAMAIFAIMAAMAYGGLKTVLDTQHATADRAAELRQLQQALQLLNEDLLQALPRPIRDELGDPEQAFIGGRSELLLTLTRATPELSPTSQGSRLQRISYRFENGKLYRLVWNTLDRTQQTQATRKLLLNAENMDVRFWGAEWTSSWPVSGAPLPTAVEIVFKLSSLGEIRRGFWLQ
ncbi:MAG: type II secretion system protein GspJ [Methylomonas sp.]|nr:MAG: type II secretion system protein GspJ [Methylomonas sp.]